MRIGLAILFSVAWVCPSLAQIAQGELRVVAADVSGLAVPEVSLDLTSQSSQQHQVLTTDSRGQQIFRGLPFGFYVLKASHPGLSTISRVVEIRSEIPREEKVTLAPESVQTAVDVSDTLLDPHAAGTRNYIAGQELENRPVSVPGRSLTDLILTQPGWVQEGSGVNHPRGVDNGTQYVIDGFPITDIRNPEFAPELNTNNFGSINILTASFPAEYGRRLGGVVEVNTQRDTTQGWHGQALGEGGSFDTGGGFLGIGYSRGKTAFGVSARYSSTDRFLDPPVEANYSNRGAESGETAQIERDLTDRDRVRLSFSHSLSKFLVPNEFIQHTAGQRQDRNGEELLGQVSYQRIISPHILSDVRVMVRDLSANLYSNSLATPILATQDRGFRETYLKGAVTAHYGRHELKAGTEAIFSSIRERFAYQITAPEDFDPDVLSRFNFADRRQDREQSFFAQDLYRFRNFTATVGIRFDHYKLLVDETAWSPRVGLSYFWKQSGIVFRASYDRVFQPPPFENLLFSNSASAARLAADSAVLPVRSARGNYWEAGFSRTFFKHFRLDSNFFRRSIRDWSDDTFLLNTGISFPTANYRAEIQGSEVKLAAPDWGRFSGYVSYTNQTGIGQLPLTGGLILENADNDVLTSHEHFQLSTVQHNTIAGSLKVQLDRYFWIGARDWYAGGLPFDFEGEVDPGDLLDQYGSKIVSKLNFERGRVRPSSSLDLSVGAQFHINETLLVRVQAEVLNVANRFNLINFAGIFSGTTIASPRTYRIRVGFEF